MCGTKHTACSAQLVVDTLAGVAVLHDGGAPSAPFRSSDPSADRAPRLTAMVPGGHGSNAFRRSAPHSYKKFRRSGSPLVTPLRADCTVPPAARRMRVVRPPATTKMRTRFVGGVPLDFGVLRELHPEQRVAM